MNVENILALADVIERQPHTSVGAAEGFTMCTYDHVCGTPACIAGFAMMMAEGKGPKDVVNVPTADNKTIMEFFGVDDYLNQLSPLFHPIHLNWLAITPAQAAATLRHLAATGEVKWEVA